jgi:hypothetical protein
MQRGAGLFNRHPAMITRRRTRTEPQTGLWENPSRINQPIEHRAIGRVNPVGERTGRSAHARPRVGGRNQTGGRAEIKRRETGDGELKMFQRVLKLVAAAADELLRRRHGNFIGGLDAVAGFAGGMTIDANCAGEDKALGLFAALAEGAFDEHLIEAGHGQKRLPLVKTRF